jgi:hypothetical protein
MTCYADEGVKHLVSDDPAGDRIVKVEKDAIACG